MNYRIEENSTYNSREVFFDAKPERETIDALKALKMRWNGKRACWYGFAAAEEIAAAIGGEVKQSKRVSSLWDRCDVSTLPAYGTENEIKSAIKEEAHKSGKGFDRCAAAYMRKHLRERFPEVKFSVTSGGAGYLDNVDICIISAPWGFVDAVRYCCGEPETRKVPDKYLDAVLKYCNALHDSFDADDGDHYADYGAHHDLYGRAEISYKYEQTQQTPELLEDMADFDRAEAKAKAEQEAREKKEAEEREAQRKIDEENARKQAEIDRANVAAIESGVTVEDVPEDKREILHDLVGGCGKENSLAELEESIAEYPHENSAIIARAVRFPSESLYNTFCNMFLHDFLFLAGMGGTCTFDPRMEGVDYGKLNAEQRESVHYVLCDCIAVYVGDDLRLVIDPEGYGYARYVYKLGEFFTREPVADYKQREQNAQRTPFYFPAPISEQIKNLTEGESVTVLTVDPWIITTQAHVGSIEVIAPCRYAQYNDAARLVLRNGRKSEQMHIHSGGATVIYKGILPDIPRDMLYTTISSDDKATVSRANYAGEGAHDFLKACISYYAGLGYTPAVDTVQR